MPTGARGRVKPKPKGYKPPPVVGGMLVETTAQKAERAKEMKAKVAAADAAAKKEKEAREAAREAARNGGGTDTEGEGAPTQAPAAEPAAAKERPGRARRKEALTNAREASADDADDALMSGGAGGGQIAQKFIEGCVYLHAFLELLCRLAHSGLDRADEFGPSAGVVKLEGGDGLKNGLQQLMSRLLPQKLSKKAQRGSVIAGSMNGADLKKLHKMEAEKEGAPSGGDDVIKDIEDDAKEGGGKEAEVGSPSAAMLGNRKSKIKPPPEANVCLDTDLEWRRRVGADTKVLEVIEKIGASLRDLHTPPSTGLMKARPPAWRFGEIMALLSRCGLLCDVAMPRLSEIVGDPATATAFRLVLTPQMVVRAWLAMRVNPLPPGVRPPAPVTGSAVVLSAQPWAAWMAHKGKDLSASGGEFINGGGLRLDEDGGGATFEEFVEFLIRCGEARYKGVSCGLPPDDSAPPVSTCAEAFLQHVTGLRSEITTLQNASRIPFPRKSTEDMRPREGESLDDLNRWKWLWAQLCDELHHIHLWPQWEGSAFDLLRYQLPRLTAIFSHYVKAGWTCVDDEAAVTMTAEAWDDFVADCAMETPTFDAERLREVYSERSKRNGGPLTVIQFIGLLIKIAFLRVHPEYKKGDLDSPEMTPVPQCVDELLKKAVYPRASSDPSIESATRQRRARGVISVLALHREKLFDLYSKLGGNVEVKQKKKEGGEGGEKQRKDSWPMVGAPEPTVGLGLDEWLKLMEESCQGWSVESLCQHSEITGEPAKRKEWKVGLSMHQAMQAYHESRSVTEWWMSRLSFVSFELAICRCAEAMFSAVDAMMPDQKIGGMIRLVLKMADRATVVEDYTYVRAPHRFDAVKHIALRNENEDPKANYTGSSATPINRWLDCWAAMHLDDIHGFPTWDAELFNLLQPYFATLCRLFAAYAAPLPKGESDLNPPPLEVWSASLEILPEHWAMLVDDMGLAHPPGYGTSAAVAASSAAPTGGDGKQDEWQKTLHETMIGLFEKQPKVDEETGARSLAHFIGALLHAAFLYANPGYYKDWALTGEVDVEHLMTAVPAAQSLLEHRVPLTLMRRCLARLHSDVEIAKAVYREKESRLQQARTRERNHAIEAAGALKRKGNKGQDDDDEPTRRPLRHQEKIDAQKAKEKAASDPAELRADVLHRQQLLDEFSRVLKRKQADLVLLETELAPMNAQEEAAKKAEQAEAAKKDEASKPAAAEKPKKVEDDEDDEKAAKKKAAAGKDRKGTPPPSKRNEAADGAKTTKRPPAANATKRPAAKA